MPTTEARNRNFSPWVGAVLIGFGGCSIETAQNTPASPEPAGIKIGNTSLDSSNMPRPADLSAFGVPRSANKPLSEGATLEKISLAYSASGEPDVVKINPEGITILAIGATWCGPCKALASDLEGLDEALKTASVAGASLIRLSVSRDSSAYGEELKHYPDGVLTSTQWSEIGIGAVPSIIVVKGGTVVSVGINSVRKIAELKSTYGTKGVKESEGITGSH